MLQLAQKGYSEAKVREVLHALRSSPTVAFNYELLDQNDRRLGTLDTVLDGEVSNNALAEIKRTARFTIRDTGEVNWLNERIQPWFRLKMPDGTWLEWPRGIFILATPDRRWDGRGVIREVEAYDKLLILKEDAFTERYRVTAGTNYITAVQTICESAGLTKFNFAPTDKLLPADAEWAPGTSKLQAVNDLLQAVNYTSLVVDDYGYLVAEPYISPADRAPEYEYATDEESIIEPDLKLTEDYFSVPNVFVGVVSSPERSEITSTYINDNPSSPVSTVSRGRQIVAMKEFDAADQAALDGLVQRWAFQASQVISAVEFPTGLVPHHTDSDVLNLAILQIGLEAKYSEHTWTLPLNYKGSMSHRIRRVVPV